MNRKSLKICVLLDEVPFPPRKNGLTLRYFSLIDTLNNRSHDLDVKIFTRQNGQDAKNRLSRLQERGISAQLLHCNEAIRRSLLKKVIVRIQALLPWGKPLSEIHYDSQQNAELFRNSHNYSSYDVTIIVGAKLLELYNALPAVQKSPKSICDLVDSPSLHFYRAHIKSNSVQLSNYYEFIKYRLWERGLRKKCSAVIYISKSDAEFVKGSRDKIVVVPNGVEYSELSKAPALELQKNSLGFVGDMSYTPNIKAVLWFLNNIWKDYTEKFPDLHFYIIGHNPAEEILAAVKGQKNITVTGYVENIWSYYKSIRFFVCPLFTGAGLQNKVIEAMFASRPVLATSIANSGVQAIDGQSILLANDKNEFFEKLIVLENDIKHRQQIGIQAREFVKKMFDWNSIVNELEEVMYSL